MSWVVLGRLGIKRCEGKVRVLEFVSVLGRMDGRVEKQPVRSAHDLPAGDPKTPASTLSAENHMQLCTALRS